MRLIPLTATHSLTTSRTNGYNISALGILTGSYGAPRTVLATLEYRFF